MSLPFDPEKSRRETLRWVLMSALDAARPMGTGEAVLLTTLNSALSQVTQRELRQALDYLEKRELIDVSGRDSPQWWANLTRYGIDIVEYTVDVHPGIARPPKYWTSA